MPKNEKAHSEWYNGFTFYAVTIHGLRRLMDTPFQLPSPECTGRIPLNPYLSVDVSGYGLLKIMGYEGSILA